MGNYILLESNTFSQSGNALYYNFKVYRESYTCRALFLKDLGKEMKL